MPYFIIGYQNIRLALINQLAFGGLFFSAAHDLSPSLFNIGFTVEIIWMASGYLEKIHYHS